MLGAGSYPITLAEMQTYSTDADKLLKEDDHERLKEFLALHPEGGDVIPLTGGVRQLDWPLKGGVRYQVFYFFHDLNMPLYLLAIYRKSETVDLSQESRTMMEQLVNELVMQHSKGWARLIQQDVSS